MVKRLNDRTIDKLIGIGAVISFLFPFFMDFVLCVKSSAWLIVKLVLIFLFFGAGLLIRGVNTKESKAWFREHRAAQAAAVCAAVLAFGIVFTTVIGS